MPENTITVRPSHTRHIVLAMIVAAYMITYMDRVNIASAVPVIQKDMGFSMITIGWIFASFRWGYAFFQIPGGWLGDRIGGRRALALVVVWWSVFTSLTAFAWNATSMGIFRFFFGMGEAGAFPIATRSLSRWMLPTERGFAQGITHAASRLGAALTPALVVMMMIRFGWRTPFFIFGLIGLGWAALWYWYYRDTPSQHSRINAAERQLIENALGVRDASVRTVPWRRILRSPSLWTLSLMYFCYGYAIDVYLDWFPKYLNGAKPDVHGRTDEPHDHGRAVVGARDDGVPGGLRRGGVPELEAVPQDGCVLSLALAVVLLLGERIVSSGVAHVDDALHHHAVHEAVVGEVPRCVEGQAVGRGCREPGVGFVREDAGVVVGDAVVVRSALRKEHGWVAGVEGR